MIKFNFPLISLLITLICAIINIFAGINLYMFITFYFILSAILTIFYLSIWYTLNKKIKHIGYHLLNILVNMIMFFIFAYPAIKEFWLTLMYS